MDREILFRGKDLITDKWLEGYYIYLKGGVNMAGHLKKSGDFIYIETKDIREVHYATVGQYTGFKDKNDNRIFKDDIIKSANNNKFLVYWSQNTGAWEVKIIGKNTNLQGYYPFLSNYLKRIEIIGNKFDNPELLEG